MEFEWWTFRLVSENRSWDRNKVTEKRSTSVVKGGSFDFSKTCVGMEEWNTLGHNLTVKCKT